LSLDAATKKFQVVLFRHLDLPSQDFLENYLRGCMHSSASSFELSLIVPVLNEAEGIAAFLRGLATQQGVVFQVLICDGGSGDGTLEKIRDLTEELPFSLRIVREGKGRAQQMNAGARVASGEYLLFLHADSFFPNAYALCTAISCLREAEQKNRDQRVAARFSLRFQHRDGSATFFYYFAECKARLDRTGCTHGDQGFLVSRHFFAEAGPFDQSCMIMEDTRFAEIVRNAGHWTLLPVEVVTSARRFEAEGPAVRQVLNMILMTLDAVGREDFIRDMPGIYAEQNRAGQLRLFPFLDRIQLLIKRVPYPERIKFWLSVGSFVSMNAWQIAFSLDVRRNFRNSIPAGTGNTPFLDHFDRRWGGLFRTRPLAVLAAILTVLSFHGVRLLTRLRGW
jgi:rSAM/selenodomain-associated transferase 2